MSLKGQVALVVGGASGIGLATAKELLREGVHVAVSDVAAAGEEVVKGLQEEFGAERTFFVLADVRDDAQLEAAFTKTKSHFKKLNIFINSAGLCNDVNWDLEVDINLKGVIRGTLLAWKHMGKQEGGSGGTVVNIASIAGVTDIPIIPIYTATKYGVIGFCRSCGNQYNLGRTGVRVMSVCPGQTETGIFKHFALMTPEFTDAYKELISTLQMQKPDNVARCVVHILKNGTSGSVWVSEDEKPAYQLNFPKYTDMRLA